MYAVMWSEHCSYKSSKVHLRNLPTEGPSVLVGPGQDAGAVDVGDGIAVVFKLESHSHPSAVEPYQGAATGVGGIVRDVISMGARPIALLDPLRFGPLADERNRWLFEGVVAGIGGYGNCIGVPTVGGEVQFAPAHTANPTVNVMCVGVAPAERLVTADREVHEGSLLVLFGAATGRDGIGGVSVLASSTLEEGARGAAAERADRRPVRREAPDRGLARARRTRPARGAAGPGRGGDHVRRERVGVPGRARRRARPRRGPAARARPGGVRDPDERVAGADARDRAPGAAGRGSGRLRAVGARDRGDRPARPRGRSPRDVRRRRGRRRPGPVARGRGPGLHAPDGGSRRRRGRDRRRPDVRDGDHAARRGVPRGARLAERGEQALGVGAVRLDRAGRDGAAARRRRGARADRGDAEGARVVDGRQGPVRRARSLPRRGARGRRGRTQRRLHRGDAARDHQLPELRQPGAPRGDVAVRAVGARDRRRMPRVRDPGDRRERQLLQRVRLLGDLADAGDRDARADRGLPPRGPRRVHGQRVVDLPAGRDVRRARGERVRRGGARVGRRGAPRRSTSNASGGSTAS